MDQSGKRGDEPGFDKTKVKVYGLGLDGGAGAGNGQTQWSMYTGSNNWTHTDKNPWGTHYNYDKPEFQDTVGWFHSLIDKGYMPSIAAVAGQGLVGHLRRREVCHDHQRLLDDQHLLRFEGR